MRGVQSSDTMVWAICAAVAGDSNAVGATLRRSVAAADLDKPGYLYNCTTSAGCCSVSVVVCLLAGACIATVSVTD